MKMTCKIHGFLTAGCAECEAEMKKVVGTPKISKKSLAAMKKEIVQEILEDLKTADEDEE